MFAYIGVSIFTFQHHYWHVGFVFIALFACILARSISIYSLSAVINIFRLCNSCSCNSNCFKRPTLSVSQLTQESIIRTENTNTIGLSVDGFNVTSADRMNSDKNEKCITFNSNRIPMNFQHMLLFSGFRGAMAFSLAIRNTSSTMRRMFFSTTIVVVMVTVLLGGCFAVSLLNWLKIP